MWQHCWGLGPMIDLTRDHHSFIRRGNVPFRSLSGGSGLLRTACRRRGRRAALDMPPGGGV